MDHQDYETNHAKGEQDDTVFKIPTGRAPISRSPAKEFKASFTKLLIHYPSNQVLEIIMNFDELSLRYKYGPNSLTGLGSLLELE